MDRESTGAQQCIFLKIALNGVQFNCAIPFSQGRALGSESERNSSLVVATISPCKTRQGTGSWPCFFIWEFGNANKQS